MKESTRHMKCPYCNSEKGYGILEYKYRNLAFFTFDGKPDGSPEDVTIHSGKAVYCRDCRKRLPMYWCNDCKRKGYLGYINSKCLACKWQYVEQDIFNRKSDLFEGKDALAVHSEKVLGNSIEWL